ncbi:hypothetical protein WA556_004388 [Blastocystis sp. ATCC 50177/Nand II]
MHIKPRSDSLTGTALHSLCWAENGKLLCAGCSDGSVLLFDASSFIPPPSLTPSYSLLHKASVAKGTITTLLYSPKHRLLFLAGHDRSIHLCSIHSHGLADEGSLDGHVGDVTSLALSPDENVLFSGGRDHSIRLWDVTSRSYLRELRCSAPKSVHRGEVTFLSTCLGGEFLLTGCNDGVLRVFRVEQKEKPKRDEVSVELLLRGVLFEEEEEDVTCEDECVDAVTVSDSCGILSASSSSSRIAVTTSSRLLVYSITSPFHLALLSSFSSHEAAVTGLCFLASHLVSVSKDTTLHVFSQDASLLDSLSLPSALTCVSALDDALLIGANDYSTYMLLLEDSSFPLHLSYQFRGAASRITDLAVLPSHKLLVTATNDGSVDVYTLPSHPVLPSHLISSLPLATHSAHIGAALAVAAATVNGRVLVATGGSDYRVNVFALEGGELELLWCEEDAHNGAINTVVMGHGFSQGLLLTGGSDARIRVWKVDSGELVGELTAHTERVNRLLLSSDGKTLVSAASDKSILVWSMGDYRVERRFASNDECVSLAMDGKSVVGGYSSGVIRCWSL